MTHLQTILPTECPALTSVPLAGHKSERMTDVYTTRLDSRMRDAVEHVATTLSDQRP